MQLCHAEVNLPCGFAVFRPAIQSTARHKDIQPSAYFDVLYVLIRVELDGVNQRLEASRYDSCRWRL